MVRCLRRLSQHLPDHLLLCRGGRAGLGLCRALRDRGAVSHHGGVGADRGRVLAVLLGADRDPGEYLPAHRAAGLAGGEAQGVGVG